MQLKNKLRRISGICVNDSNFYNRIAGKYGIHVRSRMFPSLIFLRLANIRIIKNVNITKTTGKTCRNIFLNNPIQLENAASGYKFANHSPFTVQVPQQYLRARGTMSDVSLNSFAPPSVRFPQKPEGPIPNRFNHPMRTPGTLDSKRVGTGDVKHFATKTTNKPESSAKERMIHPGKASNDVTKDITTDHLTIPSSKKESLTPRRIIPQMITSGTPDSKRWGDGAVKHFTTKTTNKLDGSTEERMIHPGKASNDVTKDITTDHLTIPSSKKESLTPRRIIPPMITSGTPDSKRGGNGAVNDFTKKTKNKPEGSTKERMIHPGKASDDITKNITPDHSTIRAFTQESPTSTLITRRMMTSGIHQPDTGSTETTWDFITVHPTRFPSTQRISTSTGIVSPVITPPARQNPMIQKRLLIRNEDVFSNALLNIRGPEARSLKPKIDRNHQTVLPESQIGFQNGDVWQKDTSLEHMDTIKNISRKNSDLVLRKPLISDEKDASENINKFHREKNVEPEIVENVARRNVLHKSTEEITVIADRVYKILETRLIIEKERRGLS